jgi:hypothetical protein
MSTPTQRAGARRLRWLILASSLLGLIALTAQAQDAPKADDRNKFENYRQGGAPSGTAESKAVFEKYAKYYVGRLTDPAIQRGDTDKGGLSDLITKDLDRRLPLPQFNSPQASVAYSRLNANQKIFVDEFGKVMIAHLEDPALKSGKPIVRINAARMASEIARSGYDGSAELFLKILTAPSENVKPGEADAVKAWALHGLHSLFEIVPDPILPEKTIFQKKNAAELPELERRSIQALIDFVFRKPETPEGTPEDEIEALRYVRREAIRALGHVRVQTVKVLGKAESRPALALLKAARGDGLTPPPNISEIVEAIIGFCQVQQLQPSRDRDMQIDYGVYHIGRALDAVGRFRVANLKDTSIPWKVTAGRLRDALEFWRRNAAENKLENAQKVQDLLSIVDRDILKPMEEGAEGVPLNLENLGQWLRDNPPKSPSLFKTDPGTLISLKD